MDSEGDEVMGSSGGDGSSSDGNYSSVRSEEDGSRSGDVDDDSFSDGSSDFHSSDRFEYYDSDGYEEEDDEDEAEAHEHCMLNFCSGGYDAEIQTALENFARESPATSSDAEEEAPDDASTVESIARDQLKRRLEGFAKEMRSPVPGRGGVPISFPINFSSYEGGPSDGPMIAYHREIVDCWASFFRALEDSKESNVGFESLLVPKIELNEHLLEMLAEHMKGRIERTMIFVQNGIESPVQIDRLAALVEGNPTLRELSICDNPITKFEDSTEATVRLLEKVREHPNLCSIGLSGCHIGDNQRALSAILESGAATIILNDNGIGSDGAGAIAAFLESNPSLLKYLELDKNQLVDDDAIRLSNALRKNNNLKGLWVRGNRFTVDGVKALYRAVYDTSSMDAIHDCNHVCQIALFSQTEGIQEKIGFINAEYPEACRRMKLKTALWCSPRDAMLCYLEDVPVKCMPWVLGFIQANTCFHKQEQTTNVVHAIVRYWNMPSLYEYRSRARSKVRRKRQHS